MANTADVVIIGGGVNDEVEIFTPTKTLKDYYYTVAIKPKRLSLVTKLEL